MIDYSLKNPPAFASHIDENNHQDGMSLRDYFAAAAMHGMLADSTYNDTWGKCAEKAYSAADAMLKARVK